MIEVRQHRRDDPQVWWHRPVIWIQGLLAPSTYVVLLTRDGVGFAYADFDLEPDLIDHEAEHVHQSIEHGDWGFRRKWLQRAWRLVFETEGFSHQTSDPEACLAVLAERASVYWLGEFTEIDRAAVRHHAHVTQLRGPRPYVFEDRR